MKTKLLLVLSALLLNLPAAAPAADNMIGRQSHNEGLLVLPAPKSVTIDGKLAEWDWSGRIWVFADTDVRAQYSVEFAAMWDAENLYIAAKWKDPTPMFSAIDPALNPSEGWKADAIQLRLRTNKISHPTMWYFTAKKMPVFDIQYGESMDKPFKGPGKFWTAKENGTQLDRGIESAYLADADGQGFVHEAKIPWAVICDPVPQWKAGDKFQMGMEFLWGDPTGQVFPIHRYADNLQIGQTSREFFWTAYKSWGDATLVDKAPVPIRKYVSDAGRVAGTIPVRVKLPADAVRFTVVLETPAGQRIRNLAGDCDPTEYAVGGNKQEVEVLWDGLDDRGKLTAPGTYRVRGLTQRGLGAEYEMCFYNPGNPPWATKDGRGAWGADHSAPRSVAAGGDWTFVTWEVPEGGSGIIGIDPAGQKRWEDRRGTALAAADAKYVYAYVTHWYTPETICRYAAQTGEPQPWDGRVFDCKISDLLGEPEPGKVVGLAVHGSQLALALSTGKVAILDAATGAVTKRWDVAAVGLITFTPDGGLYAVVGTSLARLDPATGKVTPISMPGLGTVTGLTADHAGNLVVADMGPDSQVKAFNPAGKLQYTCGKPGGRPRAGKWDPASIARVTSVAVDAREHVWLTESWGYPRRVAVFAQDGKLVREYIGNTGYAGAGSYLHDQDASLAYVGTVEMKLNRVTGEWPITRVLWVPDPKRGYDLTGSNVLPRRFRSAASGKMHEYLYLHDGDIQWGTGHLLLIEKGDVFQPVARISLVGQISGKISRGNGQVTAEPEGELAGLNAYDVVVWNDGNDDGEIQRAECEVIPATPASSPQKRSVSPFRPGDGWSGRLGDDLSIYMGGEKGITRWKPTRYTKAGAPVYARSAAVDYPTPFPGDIVPVPGTPLVLGMGSPVLGAFDTQAGQTAWTYPNRYHSVHGSHRAPMAQPGLLIGPIKICGVARVNDTVGDVALVRGNLGQDFLYTTDGLYVGAMFRDCRLPGAKLPDKEAQLRGMPMTEFSEGGEPFNGWFGKQDDGVIRLTTGLPRQAAMILRITGLESIQRFDGGTFTVDQPTLVKADTENIARAKVTAAPKTYTVARYAKQWNKIKPIGVGRDGQPQRANVQLAYDDENLYARFEVQDATPWLNEGKDFARLFKTGDAVDIQLGTGTGAQPQPGDLRVVIAPLAGQPAAILMKPVEPGAPAANAKAYTSPVGTKKFDRVEALPGATGKVQSKSDRYTVEAVLPWAALGLKPASGLKIRGDVGFISSDTAGLINVARTYWANPFTNLVNDEPLEAWFAPSAWGTFTLE